ncbi:MAG TPA: serine/threonine-protein kinase [Terriglobales bacterium]|nr:serine/threonine-protein kinase [Terriglobales bacterium]
MATHPFLPAAVEAALGQRYIVASEIAVGGQGAVFRATRVSRPDNSVADDLVALKLHLYRNQDIRVQREISAMENISHPTLARLIEHGYCDVANRHTRYVAWEFIDGQPLSQKLKQGHLLESEVVAIGRDVLAAIAQIWSLRIVHGDIKPSNIMLRDSGGAVLIDLGAARHLEQDNSPAARKPFGTAGYLSPEQARGTTALSCASDIFSLGVVMLQCLIGRHPTEYDQRALAEGLRASSVRMPVSTGLVTALDKMLSARPTFRPSPAGLASYFDRLQQSMDGDLGRMSAVAV